MGQWAFSSPTHSESFYVFPPDQRSPFIFHLANGLLSQDWALLVVKSPDRGVAWDVLDSFTLNCIRQGCMGCPGSEQFYFRLHWKSWVFLLNRALTSAFKLFKYININVLIYVNVSISILCQYLSFFWNISWAAKFPSPAPGMGLSFTWINHLP